jgi:hypothetical protein
MLDLDKARQDRAVARSQTAMREGRNDVLEVRWQGEIIATIGAEIPLSVLAPLRELDGEIALLLREAMDIGRNGKATWDGTSLIVDLLTARPDLPTTLIDVIQNIGKELLGEHGYAKFISGRPSAQDVGALAIGLFRWAGVSLGESSGSSGSPETGGPTSNATSSGSTDSTPEASGATPEIPSSSAPPA